MEIVRPPLDTDRELIEYFDRQFNIVENELNAANGISIVKAFPTKPRPGKLYSIEGHLYYYNEEWLKVISEPFEPEDL